MEVAARPVRPGRTAFAQGMFWGLLAGTLQCIFSFIIGGVGGISLGLAFFVIGLLFASIAAAWKTRRLSSGVKAGFWGGIWGGLLFVSIALLMLYGLKNDLFLRALHMESLPLEINSNQLTPQAYVLVSLLSAGYVFVSALLGSIIGAIGSVFGRIVPRRHI